MISKITKITQGKPYESQHGTLYGFYYTFEDGTKLSANHKTVQSPFKEGDQVEYEITGTFGKDGKRGKVGKPKPVDGSTPVEPMRQISNLHADPNLVRIEAKIDSIIKHLGIEDDLPF